jgi:hypothetical protein
VKQSKWKEPASFIRARRKTLGQGPSRMRHLVVFLSIAGALALIFGVAIAIGFHRHGFKGGLPLPLWVWPTIVFGVAFAIAYVIPWIGSLTVAQIAVSSNGVYRTAGSQACWSSNTGLGTPSRLVESTSPRSALAQTMVCGSICTTARLSLSV